MMGTVPLYDLSPTVRLAVMALLIASGPLLLVYLRTRRTAPLERVHALAVVTLFLTFDLVLFGAFTRLTDSGLGCPDWPGCYGSASPLGASEAIAAAQHAMPTGPVTQGKAWVEMVHRYLAMAVGVLIIVLTMVAWLGQRQPGRRVTSRTVWATATLIWVCVQGLFGALTVTMKLFPAIVTLHLLGGYILLAMLTVQVVQLQRQRAGASGGTSLPGTVRVWIAGALAMLFLQAASGAWVSTNYAVLACSDFPTCQASWWPAMNFQQALEFWRPLGMTRSGEHISFEALTAIHFLHRMLALLTLALLGSLAAYLWGYSTLHRSTRWLAALLLLQVTTGISNVVFEWPLLTAVIHTGGAGAMVVVLVEMLAATQSQTASQRAMAFANRLTQ
jgi:cytochrome c oxidase assembly protein subunit 15